MTNNTRVNVQVFKSIFPPSVFSAFLDVGPYESSLSAYRPLVAALGALSEGRKAAIATALADINAAKATGLRQVNGYTLLELLGENLL